MTVDIQIFIPPVSSCSGQKNRADSTNQPDKKERRMQKTKMCGVRHAFKNCCSGNLNCSRNDWSFRTCNHI